MNQNDNVRRLTRISMMITVIILLGFLPSFSVGFIPVPIVFQNLGILLAGLLLGKKDAVISIICFFVLLLVGFPFLAGGRGGVAVFISVTAGFLLGYIIAGFVIGWLIEQLNLSNDFLNALIATLIGVLIIDTIGGIFMGIYLGQGVISGLTSVLVFVPGDVLKAVVASLVFIAMPKKFIFSK